MFTILQEIASMFDFDFQQSPKGLSTGILEDKTVNKMDLRLYRMIQLKGITTESNVTMARRMGTAGEIVAESISRLESKNYIEVQTEQNYRRIWA